MACEEPMRRTSARMSPRCLAARLRIAQTTTDMAATLALPTPSRLRQLAPGFLLALGVALVAYLVDPVLRTASGGTVALPAMVIALLIGIVLHGVARRPVFQPGLSFCVKVLLRWAIGLLGLRIALGDIAALGLGTALLVITSMAATVGFAMWLARLLSRADGYGALAGAANAVCGASATLATATVVPDYREKAADVTFTVVAANAVSTLVMVAYPALCVWLGFDDRTAGILLGATIHDMAQVVGAGYAFSEEAGNTAVIVKLFRVFLLLPVVLVIGWHLAGPAAAGTARAKVPVPVFALVFLALCIVNSVMPLFPAALPVYEPVKAALSLAASWGMLIAIAALGLGTSIAALLAIGWRHVAVFLGATLFILVFVLAGLTLLG